MLNHKGGSGGPVVMTFKLDNRGRYHVDHVCAMLHGCFTLCCLIRNVLHLRYS